MFLGPVSPILRMVSNYMRKTTQRSWTEQDTKRAIEVNKVSSIFTASPTMVSRWVHYTNITTNLQIRNNSVRFQVLTAANMMFRAVLGRFILIFTLEMERELGEEAKYLDDLFYSLTRESLIELAFKFAEKWNSTSI
jgi:hypothetical protein